MSLKDIETLFANVIPEGKKIISTESSNLVKGGENFGGEMLKLDFVVEDENTKNQEVIHAVGKRISPVELLQKLFNIQHTFRSEILFYEKIVPILQQFQIENKVSDVIDSFGRYYGSRLNMNGSDEIDRDGIILMENLTYSGYKSIDRFVGYNLEEAQVLLKDLAALHAIPLAIKIRKPEFFAKEIRPHLNNEINSETDVGSRNNEGLIEHILWDCDKCAPYVPRVKKLMKTYSSEIKYVAREPFATFCHKDVWINNTMIKHEEGRPVSVKFVDFQLYDYRSPVIDVFLFLLTSVQTEVLKEHFDNLLKYYHSHFIRNLTELGCDDEPFNYVKFQEEIILDAPAVLNWTLPFLIFIVFGPKGGAPVPDDRNEFDLSHTKIIDLIRNSMPSAAKEKLRFLVQYFAEKNWI